MNILPLLYILDDDEMMCQFLNEKFKTDFDISTFTKEDDCLAAIQLKAPQYFIIDQNLENTTGLEFCETHLESLNNTEVIFLSSQNDLTIVFDIINSNIGKYVIKDENMLECLTHLFAGNLEAYEELL